MKLSFSYGSGRVELNIPSANLDQFITPRERKKERCSEEVLEKAFLTASLKLEDLIVGKKVVFLLEDGTRQAPHQAMIFACLKRLKRAKKVIFMVATGCHRPNTPENNAILEMVKRGIQKYGIKDFEILIHCCQTSSFVFLGETSFKTPLFVNARVLEGEVYLVTSSMKAHYFAGYCNPVKSFLPGVCKFESVEANHRLSLGEKASFGFHPYHSRAERRENPVALDMVSAMNLITQGKPVYALVVYGTEEVDWAMAGEVEEVTRRGIEVVDQRSSYEVTPRRYVIVSPGGFPSDENMYMAQRGLDLVKRAVRPGGEILLLAECRKKFAPSPQTEEYFYRRLCCPLPKIFAEIENNYKLAMQKAYKIAKIIEKTEKLWLYSNLRKEEVEAMHLYPTSSPQQVVDGWLRENPSEKILAFDQASNLAIYPAGKPKDKGVRVTFH